MSSADVTRRSPEVDAFMKREKRWRAELEALREVLLAAGLEEDLKWGQPCYALDGKNVALIHGFKEYCAVLFHKGALLDDPKGVLVQQTKNVQAARQIRYTGVDDVTRGARTLAAYLRKAIAVEKAGLEVPFKKTAQFEMPEELARELHAKPRLEAAFAALTPGRQRAYLLHFAQPKRPETRAARVAKHVPRILEGLGLDDE